MKYKLLRITESAHRRIKSLARENGKTLAEMLESIENEFSTQEVIAVPASPFANMAARSKTVVGEAQLIAKETQRIAKETQRIALELKETVMKAMRLRRLN